MRIERRRKPRITMDFVAIVRGRDRQGRRFEQHAQVCNLSARGLYLRPLRGITVGMKLFVVVRLAVTWAKPGLTVGAYASVQRVEPGDDGSAGVAVAFHRYRCL